MGERHRLQEHLPEYITTSGQELLESEQAAEDDVMYEGSLEPASDSKNGQLPWRAENGETEYSDYSNGHAPMCD